MGNNHSSPICNRLCPGATHPPIKGQDEDEWFDTGKKKRRKSSRKKDLSKMPAVPEEPESQDDGTEERRSETTTVTYNSSTRSGTSKFDAQSLPSFENDVTHETEPVQNRRHSTDMNLNKTQAHGIPQTKLTFVNGQFINLKTSEGKEIAASAKSIDEGQGPPADGVRLHEISGVEASIYAGHGGVMPASSGHRKKGHQSDSDSLLSAGMKWMGSNGSDSMCTEKSYKTMSSTGSSTAADSQENSHNSVTSIVSLGQAEDGYFLTASKYDRVIKLWRARDKSSQADGSNAKPDIDFVRDFVGHNTGVTCLARVDDKGRFLSASKDGTVCIWDSRYNCGDDEDDEESEGNRIMLAKFEKMDRRAVQSIAMLHSGTYVRPDDDIDFAMLKAAARKTIMAGTAGLQQAAREKQIIGCTCEFATITGHHNVVKIWSVQHCEDQEGIESGCNCAEVKLGQEIKNDIVVQSLTALLEEGIILTGDRMGNIKLWREGKTFLGTNKEWTCVQTFDSKRKKLLSVDEVMNFSITSLAFLCEDVFASGSRGGSLRLWNINSEKELASVNGAHSDTIVGIKLGSIEQNGKTKVKNVVFSSASVDGKVLSFSASIKEKEKCKPLCFDVVNHSITSRYFSNHKSHTVEALESIGLPNTASCDVRNVMISTSSCGDMNILNASMFPSDRSIDALSLHLQHVEQETLTLHSVAPALMNGVEIKDRKRKMMKYKKCFLGRDAVSFLVDKGHALTRTDAVDLGRILASHFDLFKLASHSGRDKLLEDDDEFYRFTDECIAKWANKRNALIQSTRSTRM